MLAGFALLWAILHGSASALGSLRGEWGILVALLVVASAVLWESLARRIPFAEAARSLGFIRPQLRSMLAACAVSVALLCLLPLYALGTGAPVALSPNWFLYVPGLMAQAGIAEETVFRGFVFRHFRNGRTFWRAALLSALPFTLVHIVLFATLDAAVAAVSLALALSMSFPLAWIFERSGNSIWPPAIVHFVAQGGIKLVEIPDSDFLPLVTVWMLAGGVLPWLLFLVRPRPAPAL